MNIKNNIHALKNNTIANNIINNTRFDKLKTSSNTIFLDSTTSKSTKKESNDTAKNNIITSNQGIKVPNSISTNLITSNSESKNQTRISLNKNETFINDLNNFLLEKISDKEFISNIAQKFVKEMMNNNLAQDIFNDSIQKNFVELSKPNSNGRNQKSKSRSSKKKSRGNRDSTTSLNKITCPHKNIPHYAKGLCKNCYHRRGRIKIPINCRHSNRSLYALGLCKKCYQAGYSKNKNYKDGVLDMHNNNYSKDESNINTEKEENNDTSNLLDISKSQKNQEINEKKEESSLFSTDIKNNKETILNVKEKELNNLNRNKNHKFQILKNKYDPKISKETLFKIQKSNNFNNLNDLFKIENVNNENEMMSSFTNSNKERGFVNGNKLNNSIEKNENLASNNIQRNVSNTDNNVLFNNVNLQSYFNNLLSNNLPYYNTKGTFPNSNPEDFSIIDDFCGNFFQNSNTNYLVDPKSDCDYSDFGEF